MALVSAPLRDLHGLIDARIKQLEEQGQVAEPAAEAAVEARQSAPTEVEQAAEVEQSAEVLEAEAADEAATDTPSDSASAESERPGRSG